MYKRGLSGVLVVVLLILLALAAAVVIWNFTLKLSQEQGEVVEAKGKLFTEEIKINRVSSGSEGTSLLLSRGSARIRLESEVLEERSGDIVFLIDSTQSMGEEIDDVKATIISFTRGLSDIDYRLALVEFRDYPVEPCSVSGDFPSIIHTFSGEQFTSDVDEFLSKLNTIEASGGSDLPEAHLTALDDSLDLPFREEARKFFIILSDAPPHAEDCLYPAPLPLDVILVNDVSSTMRDSSWTPTINIQLSNFREVNVPAPGTCTTPEAFSELFLFEIPSTVERAILMLDWESEEETSEFDNVIFYAHLRRPDGQWVLGSNCLYASTDSDPPSTIPGQYENYSGIRTKPQYVLIDEIESGRSGEWAVRIYGGSGGTSSRIINISVFTGSDIEIARGPPIRPHDAAISSALSFVGNLTQDEDRAGFITFSDSETIRHSLDFDLDAVSSSISSTPSPGGGTNIAAGIIAATQEFRDNPRTGETANKVMIILTDGRNNNGRQPVIAAAEQAEREGITIFTIGLSGFADRELLRQIASNPEFAYFTSDGSGLAGIYSQIAQTGDTLSDVYVPTYPTYDPDGTECYLGPTSISSFSSQFATDEKTLFYINKPSGLCVDPLGVQDDALVSLATGSGGAYYSYNETGGVQRIINELRDVIISQYSSERVLSFVQVVFYFADGTTASYRERNPPENPFETVFSGPYDVSFDSVVRIEVYPGIITASGREVISEAPSSVWTRR